MVNDEVFWVAGACTKVALRYPKDDASWLLGVREFLS